MTEPTQGTVLYVDDDAANRHAFSWLLRRAGFDVREAATGSEALRLVADKPDLVVLDVNLPDLDGFEVCRRLKAHPATAAIPVLHLSAVYVRPEDRRHGLEEGADAYLTKPLEPRDLIAQARALLRGRRAEERARAAVRQWQATFDALDDGVCLLDREGRVLRCNRALPRLVGKPLDEVLGRPGHELVPVTPGRGEESALLRMLATRCRQVAELRLGDRWLRATADPIPGPDGGLAGAVYILADVTERKRLEARLRAALSAGERGGPAAGVAHDLNGLLTVITGNLSVLLAAPAGSEPDRAALLAVEAAAWRAADLARQLLGSAPRAGTRSADVRACLEEVAGLLRQAAGPPIAVEVRAAPGLWAAQADAGDVHRVLLNLCLNARDAMPEGGRLLLEADNAVLDAAGAQAHPDARPGEFVRLRVCDTGRGIPAEVRRHLFEPFVTTKGPGAGTGLGLAVVLDLVRRHRGWVGCASAVGQGTWFDVYLPRSTAGVAGTAAPEGEPAGGPGSLAAPPPPGP